MRNLSHQIKWQIYDNYVNRSCDDGRNSGSLDSDDEQKRQRMFSTVLPDRFRNPSEVDETNFYAQLKANRQR